MQAVISYLITLIVLTITFTGATVMTAESAPLVRLETSLGDITIELDPAKAPATVANFMAYVDEGFYNGLIFHRVIPGFMIQGGGLNQDMIEKKKQRDPIKNEAANGLKNLTGTVAMARTAMPHSATAQFFINVADNAFLDHTAPEGQGWGYAVFGKVTEGMETVEKIAAQPTGRRGMHSDVPRQAVVIKSATRLP